MQGLNYKRLDSISNSVSPYRGSLNRFPINSRMQNTKYFLVDEENGERVFTIVYGTRHNHVSLTKEEYDEQTKDGASNFGRSEHADKTWTYQRYDHVPNILGLVRPDNTFEFTALNYYRGERGVLSSYVAGYFRTDSRRGGMVWRQQRNIMPIYQGLRVNCETMRPIKPITVIGRKVDRKAGKGLLDKYKDFYTTTEVMTKAMNYETFINTMNDVVNEHLGGLRNIEKNIVYVANGSNQRIYSEKAETLLHTAPLDAAMLYMLGWDICGMRWSLRGFVDTNLATRYSSSDNTPHSIFLSLKRRLNKEIYKANDEMFKKVEYVDCEMYPPSEWGYTVLVDGAEIKQYD